MSSFRIRPRFKQFVQGTTQDWEKTIYEGFKADQRLVASHLPGHVYVGIGQDRHFWSPQLHLTFEQDEDSVVIRGLYGPKPTLWAIFFFGYVVIGISTLFLGMWGFSRYTLGMDAAILWSVPVLLFLGAALYVAGQMGQKLGAQQMFEIHHLFESITKDKVLVG